MNPFFRVSGAGLALLLLCRFSPLDAQNVLNVPADYPKIQQAIDAAQSGDTVLVSSGVYLENLQLRGRDIVLTSRYYLTSNPASTIAQTIVDGSQPIHQDTASCLLIWRGETAATVVQGFTFTGGKGTVWLDPAGAGVFREGGGILTEGSSPIIQYNIIRNNVVRPASDGMVSSGGGGIRCGAGSVQILNNRIVQNHAEGYGGGIVLNYCPNALVANNIIAANFGGKDFSGAGFWATGHDHNTVNILRNNTIAYNQAPANVAQFGGKSGGVWVFSITLKMENNIIWGNKQSVGKPIGHVGAVLELNHNCVEGGFPGTATITADPVFRDTISFVLEAGSPAIDAGIASPDLQDYSTNQRRAAFPARGGLRTDLGAFGGPRVANPALPNSFTQQMNVFSKVMNSPVVSTPGDSRSVNWVDIDNDTDLDLFISNGLEGGENNMLYRNNGSGGFSAITNQPIVQDMAPSDGATWADFDNDGDQDCFVVNWYGINNLGYKNDGAGNFEKINSGAFVTDGGFSETASWGDYDKDGYLDLYVTNSGGNKRNFLYHNNGDGSLTKITTGPMVTDAATSRSVNWTDIDLDGDLDLFVSNENNENENLYLSENGTFSKASGMPILSAGGKTMSSSWGDYDNDGDLDLFLANDQANDALFRNNNGTFEKITTGPVVSSGGNSFGSQWADVDNDGDLDLFVTNSFWGGEWQNFLFLNQGNGIFVRDQLEVVSTDAGWSYGCAFGDFDRDGDLDLGVATCYNANQTDYLYENHSAETNNNWLIVNAIGTQSNRDAIGTKIWLHANINGQNQVQLMEISAQSGYCGQNQMDAHFGLGNTTIVDSIVVQWPSGTSAHFNAIAPNQYLNIIEGQGISSTKPVSGSDVLLRILPNPFSDTMTLMWEMPKAGQVQFKIQDMQGKTVFNRKEKFAAGAQELTWNGQNTKGAKIPAGMYVVTLRGDGWEVSKKVVRE